MSKRTRGDLRVSLRLPAGHTGAVWSRVVNSPAAVVMTMGEPTMLGPYGACWDNAFAVTQTDDRRFIYCEGLARIEGSGTIELDPSLPAVTDAGAFIRLGTDYPHAWVIDATPDDGGPPTALECTAGWADHDVAYVGVTIPAAMVQGVFGELARMGAPAASVLEILHRTRPGALTDVLDNANRLAPRMREAFAIRRTFDEEST